MAEELKRLIEKALLKRYANLLSFINNGNVPTDYLTELHVLEEAGLVELKDIGNFSYRWVLTKKGKDILENLNKKYQTTLF
jgi:predicted transcriptional regulator